MISPKRKCVEDEDSVMVKKPELAMPFGALGDIDRSDSKSSNAINISASAVAPPGLESSPMSKDVTNLKDQVEFLYIKQKECMGALNQVALEQRDAVEKTTSMISTLDQTVRAIKNQQDGMAVSERSLRDGMKETRQVLESTASQWKKITSDIQEESSRSKQELNTMLGKRYKIFKRKRLEPDRISLTWENCSRIR